MKIVYCTDSLNHLGGIQRVTAVKASALAALEENEVYVVTPEGEGKSMYPLDSHLKVIDLNIRYYSDDWKSEWHVIRSMFTKRRIHKKRLKKVLKAIEPDIVISTGTSDKYFLPSIVPPGTIVIREFHVCNMYRTFMPHKGLYTAIKARLSAFFEYKISIMGYDQLYLLTEEDKRAWKKKEKVSVMPNPNSFYPQRKASGKSRKVIAAGRYCAQKRFDNLLFIWSKITHRFPDWTLEIWGEGEDRGMLEQIIEQLGLQQTAFLKGYTSNMEEHFAESSVFVLTSDYEGFGLVIVEAMSCGLTPVCFACPAGPADIITDGENGFLIPVNDLDMFAGKLALLMQDEQRRIEMGQKAMKRADDFTPDKIAKRWMHEFNRLKTSSPMR